MLLDLLDSKRRRAVRRCYALIVPFLISAAGADALGGIDPFAAGDEMSASADVNNRILFELDEFVDRAELCFFDSADTDINGCVALNPAGWDVRAADLEDLVEGRIYGCFIRAHYDQSGETAYSDTVFSTWEALSHDIVITNSATRALGTDDVAGAQTGTRAHNYPNPFNPKEEDTRIVFEPDRSGSITMLIYDLFGHLVYEKTDADASDLSWEGRNGRGELVASGGYICVLKIGGEVVSKHKIAVIK
ncbi:MAG: hypothetical protein KAV00_14890 [Phycisphaerae bacterium]|nr:hypothetical protein [Phycisphaerae bacterium]